MTSPIDEIKSRLDIAEVIGEYVPLTPAGANFKALCPFHQEKTPSFMVSRDKQIWHCFGCGKGSDIFGFIREIEGVEFPQALRILAKKANVVLHHQDPKLQNQKTRLLDLIQVAQAFFHQMLTNSQEAQFCRDYLKRRGFSQKTIENFGLGWAPSSWEALSRFLQQKRFTHQEILLSGLVVSKSRLSSREAGSGSARPLWLRQTSRISYYDRFRNRLMFPIRDVYGNVVGFGGRTLEDISLNQPSNFSVLGKAGGHQPQSVSISAKYINTPQTLIYNKSQILYGLDKAKEAIRQEKLAILVEGYTDVIASHQAGITNVVASSGTALTQEQIKLLKRYTETMALAFDPDLAGQGASRRGIELALKQGLNVKVVNLLEGQDPAECIRKNPQAWREAISKTQYIMEYYFASTFKKYDESKVEDKKQAARILLPIIAKLTDSIEQSHWLQELSYRLKVDEKILWSILTKIKKPKPFQKETDESFEVKTQDQNQLIGERIIALALKFPQNLEYVIESLTPEMIKEPKLVQLYKNLIIYYTKNYLPVSKNKSFSSDQFLQVLQVQGFHNLIQYANQLLLSLERDFEEEISSDFIQTEIRQGILRMKKNHFLRELKRVSESLKEAERTHNQEKVREFGFKFSEIAERLKELA